MAELKFENVLSQIRQLEHKEVGIRKIQRGYIATLEKNEQVCVKEDEILPFLGGIVDELVKPNEENKTFWVISHTNVIVQDSSLNESSSPNEEGRSIDDFVEFMCKHDTICGFEHPDVRRGYKYKDRYWFFGEVAVWVSELTHINKQKTNSNIFYLSIKYNQFQGKRLAALQITLLTLTDDLLKQYEKELKFCCESINKRLKAIEDAEQKQRMKDAETSQKKTAPKGKK